MESLKFGYTYKDLVTGFQGTLTWISNHITGCGKVCLVNKDKEKYVSLETLYYIDNNDGIIYDLKSLPNLNEVEDLENAKYKFGDYVKDIITEFEGRIIIKAISITGDLTYAVSPIYNKNAKYKEMNEAEWFDESRLELSNQEISIDFESILNNQNKKNGGIATPPGYESIK